VTVSFTLTDWRNWTKPLLAVKRRKQMDEHMQNLRAALGTSIGGKVEADAIRTILRLIVDDASDDQILLLANLAMSHMHSGGSGDGPVFG